MNIKKGPLWYNLSMQHFCNSTSLPNERVFWVLVNSKSQMKLKVEKPEDHMSKKEAKDQGVSGIYKKNKESLQCLDYKKQRKPKVGQTWKKQEEKSKS